MKIIITGGTGLIGSNLCKNLADRGHDIRVLTRKKNPLFPFNQFIWDPEKRQINDSVFKDVNAIIHLAGENIAKKRWSKIRKNQLINSRVETANFLLNKITKLKIPLRHFISSSAVGYYGAVTKDTIFSEADTNSMDFLGKLASNWESAADNFSKIGSQVSIVRTGIVLSSKGGALKEMRKPFNWFLGAPLGSGNQYMPWIHIEDLSALYTCLLEGDIAPGVYNGVAPEHITNIEFTHALSDLLKKPLLLPNVPSWLMHLFFGNMAIILLYGSRISSDKLMQSSFTFKFPKLKNALKSSLQNP